MDNKVINIQKRDLSGSAESRRLRKSGKIPVSVLFSDSSSYAGMIVEREFVHLAQVSKYTDVFHFQSEDMSVNGKKALVKDLQKEPLKGRVLHVDFQALEDNQPVKVKVPVNLVGTPEGVKTQGGILTKAAQNIVVSCLPKAIPANVNVDVSSLKVGERVIASQITLPEGLVLKSNERETVASVVSSRATRLQEAEASPAPAAGKEAAKPAPAAKPQGK